MNPFDVFNNPPMIHAFAAHFPIAMGVLGIPVLFLCAVTQMKNTTLRWLTFGGYALMSLVSFGTVITGEAAYAGLPATLPPQVQRAIDLHQTLAETVWILAALTAVLVLFCAVKTEKLKAAMTMLAVIAGIVTGVWVCVTGYYGGALVHQHRIGTSGTPMTAPQALPAAGTVGTDVGTQTPSATSPPAVPNPQQSGPPQAAADAQHYSSYMTRLQWFWGRLKHLIW